MYMSVLEIEFGKVSLAENYFNHYYDIYFQAI